MKHSFATVTTVTIIIAWAVGGCSRSDTRDGVTQPPAGPAVVYAVNYPLKYFTERIGGAHVSAVLPTPPEQDPVHWKPTADVIADLQQADLILLNGAGFATWVRTTTLPQSRVVTTSKSVRDRYIRLEATITHAHGPDGEHTHAPTASMTWLDPTMAIAQADAVRLALIKTRPQAQDEFDRGFQRLRQDLARLDKKIFAVVGTDSDRPVVFSQPVYQYLIRRYQLNAKTVDWDPLDPPSDAAWDKLLELRKEHPFEWMIWTSAPADETTGRFQRLGIRWVVFDPCANVPPHHDYLTIMNRNIESLARVYAPTPASDVSSE